MKLKSSVNGYNLKHGINVFELLWFNRSLIRKDHFEVYSSIYWERLWWLEPVDGGCGGVKPAGRR